MVLHKERLLNYFYSNIIGVIGALSIFVGAVVYISFALHIRYMPEFDFASSATIISALSITAAVFLFIMMVISIFPGVIWDLFWSGIADSSKVSSYWHGLTVGKTIGMLFLWFVVPASVTFVTIMQYILTDYLDLTLVVVFGSCFLIFFTSFSGLSLWSGLVEFLLFSFISFIVSMLAFFPFLLFAYMITSSSVYQDSASSGQLLVIYVIIPSLVVFSNIIVAAPTPNNTLIMRGLISKKIVKNSTIGITVVLMVILACSRPSLIPSLVMQSYSLGDIKVHQMFFKSEGCSVLKNIGVDIEYTKETNSFGKEKDICYVEDLMLLSRLGSEKYIKVTLANDEYYSVAMPASYVISWVKKKVVLEPKQEQEQEQEQEQGQEQEQEQEQEH